MDGVGPGLRQWTVDAFARKPFEGNPACVVEPLEAWPAAGRMQALAAENNQSETAFLLRTAEPNRFGLRWFTPTLEVPLCGHATLASAHVLFAELGLASPAVRFDTASGGLSVRREDAGAYVMDFPALEPRRIETPAELESALGARVLETWVSRYLVAILDSPDAVRALAPDVAAVGRISGGAAERGNLVVAAATGAEGAGGGEGGAGGRPPADVVDRFFAPGSGIAEDPATGSAHCILAPLYAARLGREILEFEQAFPGRGARIGARLKGDRVELLGAAVTIFESRLRISLAGEDA